MPSRPKRWREPSALPIDLSLTVGPLQRGRSDPTMKVSPTSMWRAFNTPDGPATLHLEVDARSAEIEFEAWGVGRDWALDHARGHAGLEDDPEALRTDHPLVRRAQRAANGLRLCSVGAVHDVVTQTILEQRVTGKESKRAWRSLAWRYGEPAPGPVELRLPASPETIAGLSDAQRHQLGIETSRGRTLSMVAGESSRLQRAAEVEPPALARRLRSLRGIGPWTTALVTHYVQGDADAVPVGDYHICHDIVHAFTGAPRGSDEEMLELLEPFRGQRGRVVRLLIVSVPGRPRVAPRAAIPDRIIAERDRPRSGGAARNA